MSINSVSISGNLVRDAELRSTQSGTAVLSFSVAVNERVKDGRTGEWGDRPNFIDCVLWGNRAEVLSKMLEKGCKVAVSGRLRWSQWERDGQKRSKIEVIVEDIDIMSGKRQEAPTAYDADIPF